jgi:hypothetical protein
MRTVDLRSGFSALAVLAAVTATASCTDPVRDTQIAQLGDEDPSIPQGPEHRAGQPCVLCHSAGGPASDKPFMIGGTVYETANGSQGADGVRVVFVDSVGAERAVTTNAVGNFFIREAEWSDLAFPFKVGVKRGNDQEVMNTTINREGSCNFCHRPGKGSYDAVPQVYLKAGGT